MTKPGKPENYWRDYFVISILALIPVPITIYYELNQYLLPLLPILIVVVLPLFWFRSYYSELRKNYEENNQKSEIPAVEENTQVNQNIERYVKAQRLNRQQAKWWQFWI